MKYFSFILITIVILLVSFSTVNSVQLIFSKSTQVSYFLSDQLKRSSQEVQDKLAQSLAEAIVNDFNN